MWTFELLRQLDPDGCILTVYYWHFPSSHCYYCSSPQVSLDSAPAFIIFFLLLLSSSNVVNSNIHRAKAKATKYNILQTTTSCNKTVSSHSFFQVRRGTDWFNLIHAQIKPDFRLHSSTQKAILRCTLILWTNWSLYNHIPKCLARHIRLTSITIVDIRSSSRFS